MTTESGPKTHGLTPGRPMQGAFLRNFGISPQEYPASAPTFDPRKWLAHGLASSKSRISYLKLDDSGSTF